MQFIQRYIRNWRQKREEKELYFYIPEIGAFEYVRMAESQPSAVILRIKLIEPAPVLKYGK